MTLSDHSAILAVYGNTTKSSHRSQGHKFINYRSMNKFNAESFLRDLTDMPWSVLDIYDDPNDALSMTMWYKLYGDVLDVHAPITKKRVKHWQQPKWINQEILDAIHHRDKLFRQKKFEQYKKQRNLVKSMIAKTKKQYFKGEITSNKGDAGKLHVWNCIKELQGGKTGQIPSAVKDTKGNLETEDVKIASVFNQHFAGICQESAGFSTQDCITDKLKQFIQSKNPESQEFIIPPLTEDFVLKQLKMLDGKKAKGMDNLNPYFLKLSSHVIAPALTQILNLSLKTGIFPEAWKVAKVSPLHN